MKYLFTLFILIQVYSASSQILNSGFDNWEFISYGGQPFENPVGWKTNNDDQPFGLANTPVTKEADSSGFHAKISAAYRGIDAFLPGKLMQTISTDHLAKINFYSKCDSIFQLGRCVINILSQSGTILYTDSLALEDPVFHSSSILIQSEWIQAYDSLTIQFVAKGNLDNWDEEEDGYSIFLVDNVEAAYSTSVENAPEHVALILYPNPSSGMVNIECAFSKEPEQVEIFSLSGESLGKLNFSTMLDLAWLPDGAYFIRVLSNEKVINKLLIIEH
ncbi:MAG: T9SS type A sorting domain-containing protein [Saprospiraceae bacterium]